MKKLLYAVCLMMAGMVSNSFALSTDAQAVFTAIDTAGLSTAISGVLVAFIGIALVFLAYRYGKKAINRG